MAASRSDPLDWLAVPDSDSKLGEIGSLSAAVPDTVDTADVSERSLEDLLDAEINKSWGFSSGRKRRNTGNTTFQSTLDDTFRAKRKAKTKSAKSSSSTSTCFTVQQPLQQPSSSSSNPCSCGRVPVWPVSGSNLFRCLKPSAISLGYVGGDEEGDVGEAASMAS